MRRQRWCTYAHSGPRDWVRSGCLYSEDYLFAVVVFTEQSFVKEQEEDLLGFRGFQEGIL